MDTLRNSYVLQQAVPADDYERERPVVIVMPLAPPVRYIV